MVVPIKLATTTLRIEVGIPVFSPPILSIFASSKESPSVPRKLYWPGLHRAPGGYSRPLLTRPHLAGQRALGPVAADVPGLRDPELGCMMPGHLILLARRGIYIMENLVLEDLAVSGHRR